MSNNNDRYIYGHAKNHDELMAWWEAHEGLHWMPHEVSMGEDLKDWAKAPPETKAFLRNLLTFFVQADIEVEDVYLNTYMSMFGNSLPVKMCLASAAAREGVHIRGYAHLNDTFGFGADVYSEFLEVPVLASLHTALNSYVENAAYSDEARFKAFVATTLFGEGVMLFGQFAMLMNYKRHNQFKGQATIVQWSVRDEDMHVQLLAQLAKEHFKHMPKQVQRNLYWQVELILMPLILCFVDYCYDAGAPVGLTKQEVYDFLEYQAKRRARQVGILDKEEEFSRVSPLPWFDQMVAGTEHTNFFERRATAYSKGNLVSEWDYTEALKLI